MQNNSSIKLSILEKIQQVEAEYGCTTLFAVESGSRAWDFASTNSDFDVRFVYVRPMDDYLLLNRKRDVIIREYPGDLDFHGWDLEKALKLLYKGNPPFLEWLRSPVQYKGGSEHHLELKTLSESFWGPQTATYHYLHMAKGNYKAYIRGRFYVKQKKYLYILRPLMCCQYIEKFNEFPPVRFQDVLDALDMSKEVRREIDDLVALKKASKELSVGRENKILNAWIEDNLTYYENYAKVLRNPEKDMRVLDDFFKKVIK